MHLLDEGLDSQAQLNASSPSLIGTFLHLQESRQWVEQPDGAIVTAESARAGQERVSAVIRKAQGDDYYELLQVPQGGACARH